MPGLPGLPDLPDLPSPVPVGTPPPPGAGGETSFATVASVRNSGAPRNMPTPPPIRSSGPPVVPGRPPSTPPAPPVAAAVPPPAAAVPVDQLLQVGNVVAERYKLEAKIGQGGMASVFRAHDLELQEQIALKVFTTKVDDEQLVARFKQELSL